MKHKILLWSGIILAIIVIAGYFYVQSGSSFGLENPVNVEKDTELNLDNTQIYSILAQAGINDAVVDVKEKEVLVALRIPESKNKDDVLSFIYGTTTGYAQNAETITIHLLLADNSIEEYTVTTNNVILYADGKISKEEFDKRVEKKTIDTKASV